MSARATTDAGDLRRHKGLGISAFAIGVAVFLLTVVLFTVAGLLSIGGQATEEVNVIVGTCIFLLWGIGIIGIALGIGGAADRASKKVFPVLGISMCAGTIVLSAALVAYGLSIE